jgi:putative RNA 2'-phosphotransferase
MLLAKKSRNKVDSFKKCYTILWGIMKKRSDKELSKFLSLVLRHQPSVIGLTLDNGGWADVSSLISKIDGLTMDRLEVIVKEDDKQRYSFNHDKTKLRANQGHSVAVDLQLNPMTPPEILYHGTAEKNEINILGDGLRKMQRQHVHLSQDFETAKKVAARREGKSVIFRVHASQMFSQGYEFFCSENGVWLTDYVPAMFLEVVGYCDKPSRSNSRAAEFDTRVNRT